MSKRFTIIHLSDAHIGNPKHNPDSITVLEPLIIDIKKIHEESEITPDLIVFSGDLAFGEINEMKLRKQYELAKDFLKEVYNSLGVSYGDIPILLVPGNHDIDRTKITRPQMDYRNKFTEDYVYKIMQDNSLDWKQIRSRQEEWFKFAQSIPKQQWYWDNNIFIQNAIVEHENWRIGIVGLNSSWASHEEEEKSSLWIGKYQYNTAFLKIKDADIKIAALHHPVEWLNEKENSWLRQRFEMEFNILFQGHEHSSWFTDLDNHLKIEAGACYAGSKELNCYSWTEIDLENFKGLIRLRKYNDYGKGGWEGFSIPGKTKEDGTAKVSNFLNKFRLVKSGPSSIIRCIDSFKGSANQEKNIRSNNLKANSGSKDDNDEKDIHMHHDKPSRKDVANKRGDDHMKSIIKRIVNVESVSHELFRLPDVPDEVKEAFAGGQLAEFYINTFNISNQSNLPIDKPKIEMKLSTKGKILGIKGENDINTGDFEVIREKHNQFIIIMDYLDVSLRSEDKFRLIVYTDHPIEMVNVKGHGKGWIAQYNGEIPAGDLNRSIADLNVFIAIEGPIGGGKSTLAKNLQTEWGTNILLEKTLVEKNVYMKKFYQSLNPEDAFPAEVNFLLNRYDNMKAIGEHNYTIIADYFFEKGQIFGKMNLGEKNDLLRIYNNAYYLLKNRVPKPDYIIYLKCSAEDAEILHGRIAKRQDLYDAEIPLEYLRSLCSEYDEFFDKYDEVHCETIDIAKYDTESWAVLSKIKNRIKEYFG